MKNIDGHRLKELRERKGLTQEDLAQRSKVNKQTISRLERGKSESSRGTTINTLCEVLGVEISVLTGEDPIPEHDQKDTLFESKSELRVQITNATRNALSLVSQRYNIRISRLVELAPMLIVWAAEECLQRRTERLDRMSNLRTEHNDIGEAFPYLNIGHGSFIEDDIELAERQAILEKDLFGDSLFENTDWGIANNSMDSYTENPFAVFLSNLAKDYPYVMKFNGWNSLSSPDYEVCPDEAIELVGGDIEAAGIILRGSAPLHEMRKDLKHPDKSEARAVWAKEQGTEELARFKKNHPEIFDSLLDLLKPNDSPKEVSP